MNSILLPFHAYNEYETEYREAFQTCSDAINTIQSIINEYTNENNNTNTNSESPLIDNSNNDDDIINEVGNNENNFVNTEPLPLPEFNNEPKPSPLQLLLFHLQLMSEIRPDLDDFLTYIKDVYNVDLTQYNEDLPFEVIDEILSYVDYDPDETDSPLDFNMFNDERIILNREDCFTFQRLINTLRLKVKELSHLHKMNVMTNDRNDEYYLQFQQMVKPVVSMLLQIYKSNILRYERILQRSIQYHIITDEENNSDMYYSDHDQ